MSLAALLLAASFAAAAPEGASAVLTLERSLELASQRNFELRRARAALEAQDASILRARGALLPSLDADARYQETDPNRLPSFGGARFGAQRNWNASIDLKQPLFSGGLGGSYLSREKLRRRAAEEALAAAEQQAALETRERFYGVLLARAQVGVREEAVRLLEEELEREKSRFAAGAVSQFNVLRAEVALANSRTPLIRARNGYRLALEDLRRVLGLSAEEAAGSRVEGDLEAAAPPQDLEEGLSSAQRRRPELRRLSLLRDAEVRSVRMARAGFYPSLEAFAGYEFESDLFGGGLSKVNKGWIAGLSANWNLFSGGATRGAVQAARSVQETAAIELERARLEVEVEVRRAHSALTEAEELLSASLKVVEQAEEALRLARSREAAGASTQLDVLEARVALTEARTNEVQARHDLAVARARFARAAALP